MNDVCETIVSGFHSGFVEGLNLRINLCIRKAYGYRSFDLLQTSLYHTLGDLL